MTIRRQASRGFSLFELLLIMVVVSILAGIALPTMRQAIDKAEAARIMTDVRNVTVAVRSYVEEKGTLPNSAPWGVSPPELQPYLSEAVAFTTNNITYRLVTAKAAGTTRLVVRYPNLDPIGVALKRFVGTDITWTNTRLTVWIQR